MPLHMIENVTIPSDFNLPNRLTLEQKAQDDALFEQAKECFIDCPLLHKSNHAKTL